MAMLFDLDGVLIHSMPLHVRAWNRYLTRFGRSCGELERVMHGKRNSELVRELFGDGLAEEVVFDHGAAKERLFREMLLECDLGAYRVPGLTEFLERHKDVMRRAERLHRVRGFADRRGCCACGGNAHRSGGDHAHGI